MAKFLPQKVDQRIDDNNRNPLPSLTMLEKSHFRPLSLL
jgi:hypothetical protein